MSNSSIRNIFFEECEELLEALDQGLNSIEGGLQDPDTINAIFRAVHSIKGGAGAFGLDELVSFAHTFETLFDEVRSERLALDEKLVPLLFRASDHLSNLVEGARDEVETDRELHAEIIAKLADYLPENEEEVEITFEPMVLNLPEINDIDISSSDRYKIVFRPFETLFFNGHEPLFLFRALAELGDVDVKLDIETIPKFEKLETHESNLRWTLVLTTEQTQSDVETVFEFVDGLCELEILKISEDVDVELCTELKVRGSENPIREENQTSAPTENSSPKIELAQGRQNKASNTPKPTLRVDLDRIDRLINTVGELIINQAMLAQHVSNMDGFDVRKIETELEDYKHLARDIQEGVMAIRSQPVKPLFQRMARIVREASSATGKSAKLVTHGENTEVDKTVIERLADPLTHMIRNAVDHGLETAEKRLEAGKSEIGEIQLSATHRSGSIFIEISDDGAGLNREKIYDIALSKGLIEDGEELTGSEIDALLFRPGFSTASEVSNLSGRGVGLDVVKNAVVALGGRVAITSIPGQGTTFSITLPLTLAVMDGMVVSIAGQTMIVPINSIIETVRPTKSSIHQLGAEGSLLSIRGEFLPIVDTANRLGLEASDVGDKSGVLLVVETENCGQCALAVNAIYDQRQVVIKSLKGAGGDMPGVSAATILGDGKIAMILDPEGIVKISPETIQQPSAAQELQEI